MIRCTTIRFKWSDVQQSDLNDQMYNNRWFKQIRCTTIRFKWSDVQQSDLNDTDVWTIRFKWSDVQSFKWSDVQQSDLNDMNDQMYNNQI